MKLYTRRGDAGQTDLFGGQRVDKDALRVDAYGTVDELNAAVGLAIAACDDSAFADLRQMLTELQSRLFEVGSDLATPPLDPAKEKRLLVPRVTQAQVDAVERQIDAVCDGLPEMRSFVLPGGCEVAAHLHLARCICRRAERLCVALSKHEPVGEAVVVYLNRLSDLLFAMARRANHVVGVEDVPWISPRQQKA